MSNRNMRPLRSGPHHRSHRGPEHRAARTAAKRGISNPAQLGILDAVQDQHGGRWIRYGTRGRSIWFAIADLIGNAPAVFSRLSSVGTPCLTTTSQNALKRDVEAHHDYREALVASRPGWLEGIFVFGDGSMAAPDSDEREVIMTFEPNRKFTPQGSLEEWQAAVGLFVARQPLAYFAVALALVGPLLRFAPRGYLNPQVEIVGDHETGKSTIGVLAASVWAGDPGSDTGGGESWDRTLNSLDDLKSARRDGFAFLDEGNLAGSGSQDSPKFAREAVFKFATTGKKRRMGDPADDGHARAALLSTSNTALANLIGGSAEVRGAAQSRMITIRISHEEPHGVFAFLPRGYSSGRAASEALVEKTDRFWGTVSRAFVDRLVDEIEHDEERLKAIIAAGLKSYMRLDTIKKGSARVQKTFAIVMVAAALAKRWGVLPSAWGAPMLMVQAVARAAQGGRDADTCDALSKITAYVEQHRSALTEVTDLDKPLSKDAFEDSTGFLREMRGYTEVLIPATQFQAAFPEHEVIMRTLRAEGRAQTEGGREPKLAIKTPRAICAKGRVYCIRIDRSERNVEPRTDDRHSERGTAQTASTTRRGSASSLRRERAPSRANPFRSRGWVTRARRA